VLLYCKGWIFHHPSSHPALFHHANAQVHSPSPHPSFGFHSAETTGYTELLGQVDYLDLGGSCGSQKAALKPILSRLNV